MKNDLRIVFMGTPDFAVQSLKRLVENNYNVVAVLTMPDKPAGRGHKIKYSAVKEYAMSQNIEILQPTNLKDPKFIEELKALKADLQIVVAFRMLPEVVWNMPKFGTFNLHASLLPQYRGAAPINWAIINGEKTTGATTFFLTHEIDTGKIIIQKEIEIGEKENAETVHDRLMNLGAKMVTETVDLLLEGKIEAIDQSEFIKENVELKPAPKLFKENCQLPTNLCVADAYNFIRGLSPYPAAWTELKFPTMNEPIITKIFESEKEIVTHNHETGTLIVEGKKSAKIALKDGFLHLKEIQIAGKKRMKTADLLNGLK